MKSAPLISILFLLLYSCDKYEEAQDENLDTSQKQVLQHISYGAKPSQSLNITLPRGRNENTPVVIFIHGGARMAGDKNNFDFEIQQFADAGIACASINYRYASTYTKHQQQDLCNDVNTAIDFLVSKSSKWKISRARFGLVGQGDGGLLAMSVAYRHNDGRIKACASWGGTTNLLDKDQLKTTGTPEFLKTFVGAPLLSTADSVKYKQASPYWMASSYSVPTLLVHGTRDPLIPYSNAVRMQKQLTKLGVKNSLYTLSGSGNVWTGKRIGEARTTTLSWFQGKL